MLLLIDNHDSFTYNLVDLLRQLNQPFHLVTSEQVTLEIAQQARHILISPGPDIPSAYPHLFSILQRVYQQKSILGICLGHQILGEFFGGKLYNLPKVRHGLQQSIEIVKPCRLFQQLPTKFNVGLYHSWALDPNTLPQDLIITAQDSEQVIMAIQHRSLPIYGVQFHPESFISEYGSAIIRNWLKGG